MTEFTAAPSGEGRRIVVVASRFNETVTSALVSGALDALARHGTLPENVDLIHVPGAWEIPAAVRLVCASGRYDAVVAIGAVIRGETPHFDFVAGETARALQQVVADFDVPVGLGLLTTDTLEQAEARAGGDHGNKGWDAALAALEMAELFDMFHSTVDGDMDELEETEALISLRRASPGSQETR